MQASKPPLWEESRLKTLYLRRRIFRCIGAAFTLVLFPIIVPVKAIMAFAKDDEKEIREIEQDLLVYEYEASKDFLRDLDEASLEVPGLVENP